MAKVITHTERRLADTPWTQVIPLDTAKLIQQLAESRAAAPTGTHYRRFMFSGKIFCPDCGGLMRTRNVVGEQERELRCDNRAWNSEDCGFSIGMPLSQIEKVVMRGLASTMSDPAFDDAYLKLNRQALDGNKDRREADRTVVERDLARETAKLDRLLTAFVGDDDLFSDDALIMLATRTKKAIAAQSEKIATLQRNLQTLTVTDLKPHDPETVTTFAEAIIRVADDGLFLAESHEEKVFQDKVSNIVQKVVLAHNPNGDYDVICTFDFGPLLERPDEPIIAELAFPLEVWRVTTLPSGTFGRIGLKSQTYAMTGDEFAILCELESVKRTLGALDEIELRASLDIFVRACCFNLSLIAGAEFHGLNYARFITFTWDFRMNALTEFVTKLQELRPDTKVDPRCLLKNGTKKTFRRIFEVVGHPVLELTRCNDSQKGELTSEERNVIKDTMEVWCRFPDHERIIENFRNFFVVMADDTTFTRIGLPGYSGKYQAGRMYEFMDIGSFDVVISKLLELEGKDFGSPENYPVVHRYKPIGPDRLQRLATRCMHPSKRKKM